MVGETTLVRSFVKTRIIPNRLCNMEGDISLYCLMFDMHYCKVQYVKMHLRIESRFWSFNEGMTGITDVHIVWRA